MRESVSIHEILEKNKYSKRYSYINTAIIFESISKQSIFISYKSFIYYNHSATRTATLQKAMRTKKFTKTVLLIL